MLKQTLQITSKPEWVENGVANALETNLHGLDFKDFLNVQYGGELRTYNSDDKVQSKLYQYCRRENNTFALECCMQVKIQKSFGLGENYQVGADACRVLKAIRGHVPPAVLFVVISAWSNGWETQRRFQKKDSRCMVHRECSGEDDILHYCCCDFLWTAWLNMSKVQGIDRSWENFFLFGLEGRDTLQIFAAFMYAVKFLTDKNRRCAPCNDLDSVASRLKEGVRTAVLFNSSLRLCLSSRGII